MASNQSSLSNAFQKAMNNFRADLRPEESDEIACTTLPQLKKTILEIQQKQISVRKANHMARLKRFLEAMEQYGKVVEVFLNTSNLLAFVWVGHT
jgi:hypothetical protein